MYLHHTIHYYTPLLHTTTTLSQANPFAQYGQFAQRTVPKYDLQMYAENYKVCTSALYTV